MSDAAWLSFDGVDLYFPAVLSESAEHSSTTTEHVVEEGANITDHVRPNPTQITLEVFLSNTPIQIGGPLDMQLTFVTLDVKERESDGPIALTPGALIQAGATALNALISGAPTYRAAVLKSQAPGTKLVREVVQTLETWRTNAVLGKVYLPWQTYDNVVITKLTPTRDAATGDAAKVSIEFRQIRLVEARVLQATITREIRAKPMVNKGKQPTAPVDEVKKSLFKEALDQYRANRRRSQGL